MNLADSLKEEIIKEIQIVIKKMKEEDNPEMKIYYFSAIPAIFQRVFNLSYDKDLVFCHFALNTTNNAINQRLQAIKSGEVAVQIFEEHFEKIIIYSNQLAKKIRNNEDPTDILKKFIILAYSTTGNGFYLLQKGMIKFPH